MVSILKETMLIEAHINEIRVDQIYIKDSVKNYYAEVFQKYQVTKDEFEKSLEHYSAMPDTLHLIYSEVLDNLLAMEVELESVQINTEKIQPIGKNIVSKIIQNSPIHNLFLKDTISKNEIMDSIEVYFTLNDSLLKSNNTNLSSFKLSLNNIMHNQIIYSTLLIDLKKDTIPNKDQ